MTIPDAALVSLAPYTVSGWLRSSNVGYYIHKGRVYLQGTIESDAGVTAAIFTGMPAEIRPPGNRSFILYTDFGNTDDPLDPALTFAAGYAATMHPDGSFSLDAAPPAQVVSTPGGTFLVSGVSYPRYINPLNLTLALPNVSWALDVESDIYTPDSFAPYLSPDFEDIDSTILVHGVRVHLGGHVRATVDQAAFLTTILPVAWEATGPDGPFGFFTAQDPRDRRVGVLDHRTIAFANDAPGITDVPDQFPWLSDANFLRPGVGVQNIFQVGDAVQRATVDETYDAACECTIYNLACVPEGTSRESPAIHSLPPGGHSATGSVATLLANYDPPPDWIIVEVSVEYTGGEGFGSCYPCVSELGEYLGGGCIHHLGRASVNIDAPGPLIDNLGASTPSSLSFDYDAGDVGSAVIGTLAGVVPNVYVSRPTVAYTGAPDDWRNLLLWRPGEIDDIVFTWDGTQSDSSLARWFVVVHPLWERRAASFLDGDVLDLTGCGWNIGFEAPDNSTVLVGPQTPGHRHRRPTLGTTSTAGATSPGTELFGAQSTVAPGVGASGFIPPPSSRT